MSLSQKQKDTIREEFEELTKEPIGRDEVGNEYSIWDVVFDYDKDQTEVGVIITDWWLSQLDQAYQQGAKDKVEEVSFTEKISKNIPPNEITIIKI
jgi:hypothetical protein